MTDAQQTTEKNEPLEIVKGMAMDVWKFQAGLIAKTESQTVLADWKGSDMTTIGRALCRMSTDLKVQARADNSPLTSPDFPVLVGQALETGAAAAWPEIIEHLRWMKSIRLPDFRENYVLTSTPPELLEQAEAANVLPGKPLISKETVTVKTFSRTVRIGDQLYYGDRSGIFIELGKQFALSAASMAADLAFEVLTGNPALSDGDPWLAVSQGNQAATGAALDATSLSAALAGLRAQRVNNLRLNLGAAYLLVGGNEELAARQLTRDYFSERAMSVVTDDRLTGHGFFLLASPQIMPAVARLQIVPNNPLSISAYRQDAGLTIKATCDQGAAAVNRAGIYWTPPAS